MKFYEEKGFSPIFKEIEDQEGHKLDIKSIKIRKYESLILYYLNYKLDYLLCDRINNTLYYINSFFSIEEINQYRNKSFDLLNDDNYNEYINKRLSSCFKFSIDISKTFILNDINYISYTHEDISFCSILISKEVFGFRIENKQFSSKLLLEFLFDCKVNINLFDSMINNYKNYLDLSEYEKYL